MKTKRIKLFSTSSPFSGGTGGVSETDKVFAETRRKRISLFSEPQKKKERISLFSKTTPSGSKGVCKDCGCSVKEFSDRCPNCGGNRIVKVSAFSDSDTTGEFLERVAGSTLSLDEATKVFSECGVTGTLQDLVDSGYATITEDSEVSFSDTVDTEYRLFGKLVISVTKELELPETSLDQREDLIQSMSSLSPRGKLLIMRAHQVIPHPTDIGTVTGLPHEGQDDFDNTMTLQEFLDYLRTKYNDAPENLQEILCKNGIVEISGSRNAKHN